MAATLVVARGPSLYLVGPEPGPARELRTVRRSPALLRPAVSPEAVALARAPGTTAGVGASASLATWGRRAATSLSELLGSRVAETSPRGWRTAASSLPPWPPEERRSYLLAVARAELERRLRSPEEVVISLAREEERVERSVEREARASETFVSPPATPLEEYAREWSAFRSALSERHRSLRRRLEEEAENLVPNLAAVVGARVAARLVAAAGGLAPLARMSSSRLQLLGARRRPSPERGPRYGLLYRADCLDDVPASRRAALARSVASLAVIAARADATTHAAVAPGLLTRLERRIVSLNRGPR